MSVSLLSSPQQRGEEGPFAAHRTRQTLTCAALNRNVDNSKAEALFATVRIHGLPVQIREIKFERDEVSRVEGEFNVIPGAKFSVTFKDMFLQHITSTFTRIRVNGKECARRSASSEEELIPRSHSAGCIKMDKDRRPLSAEPSHEREWTVSAWADGTVSCAR